MAKAVGKEVGFHKGVMAFFKLTRLLSSREPGQEPQDQVAAMAEKLVEISQSLPGHEAEFAGALASISEMGLAAAPALPRATAPLNVQSVKWKPHEDKNGRRTHYTALWSGMRLRVERTRDDRGKIVFYGYIDEENIVHGKGRVVVRDEVAAEARRRFVQRTD